MPSAYQRGNRLATSLELPREGAFVSAWLVLLINASSQNSGDQLRLGFFWRSRHTLLTAEVRILCTLFLVMERDVL